MNTTTNDHDAVLAAIAEAAEQCGREAETTAPPLSQPAPQQQVAPFFQGQPQDRQATAHPQAQTAYAHPAFQPQQPKQPAQTGRPIIEGAGPTDEEMREVFDERKKKKFKVGLVVNMALLAILIIPCLGFTAWYHSSPKNKESFAALMQNFREVPKDVKSMANIKESYDEALGEIGARGDTVDAATLALGVDAAEFEAAAAAENDDAAFLNEHAERTAINN